MSFSVRRGEFVGILGANDTGKSTLTRLANGLLLPTHGQVIVDGIDLQADEQILYQIRQKIGVVFADPENQIVATTVEEEVAFGLGNLCIPCEEMQHRVHRYLERFDLLKYMKQSPNRLSGGEQQKLCLASVLAMEPDCLLLDDPLTFLDSTSRREIFDLLQEFHAENQTILYLTSDPEELIPADRILLLHKGTLLSEHTPAEIWNDLSLLQHAGITPSEFMLFRDTLKQKGYAIEKASITPEAIVRDMLDTSKTCTK